DWSGPGRLRPLLPPFWDPPVLRLGAPGFWEPPLPLWLGLHHRLPEDLHLLLPAAQAEGHQLLLRGAHRGPHAVADPGHAAGGLRLHLPLQNLLPSGFRVFGLAGKHPSAEPAPAEDGGQRLHG
ncbi:hypothetical protein EK904_010813, partial [Melospiza melodia maxima]